MRYTQPNKVQTANSYSKVCNSLANEILPWEQVAICHRQNLFSEKSPTGRLSSIGQQVTLDWAPYVQFSLSSHIRQLAGSSAQDTLGHKVVMLSIMESTTSPLCRSDGRAQYARKLTKANRAAPLDLYSLDKLGRAITAKLYWSGGIRQATATPFFVLSAIQHTTPLTPPYAQPDNRRPSPNRGRWWWAIDALLNSAAEFF